VRLEVGGGSRDKHRKVQHAAKVAAALSFATCVEGDIVRGGLDLRTLPLILPLLPPSINTLLSRITILSAVRSERGDVGNDDGQSK
jgi:hypothetical protein